MKENYQKQLDALLSALPPEEKPRLLLQSCCGPCSSYVLEYLTRYFRVTVLYYNPNIQPRAEYDRRLYWQQELIRRLPTPEPVALLACDYDGQRYIDAVRGLEREPEGGARCTVCFRLRLEETARQARAHGFDYFGTTLTVSPHKDAQRLNTIGAELAQQYGVRWLPSDFKKPVRSVTIFQISHPAIAPAVLVSTSSICIYPLCVSSWDISMVQDTKKPASTHQYIFFIRLNKTGAKIPKGINIKMFSIK